MSDWLSWGRQKLGLESARPPPHPGSKRKPQEINEKSQALLKSMKMQHRQMESQLKDIEEETGNVRALQAILKKRNLHVFQMNQLGNKLRNHETTHTALGTAEQNLEQTIIMEHTAGQMEQVMEEIQAIDLDRVVDTLHDQIGQTTGG